MSFTCTRDSSRRYFAWRPDGLTLTTCAPRLIRERLLFEAGRIFFHAGRRDTRKRISSRKRCARDVGRTTCNHTRTTRRRQRLFPIVCVILYSYLSREPWCAGARRIRITITLYTLPLPRKRGGPLRVTQTRVWNAILHCAICTLALWILMHNA